MQRTIISHNTTTGEAEVKFEHAGVVYQDTFNLKLVIPGSEHIFNEMGIEFTKKHQLVALDKLTSKIESQIDQGIIKNIPSTEEVPYNPPPVITEEEITEENTDPNK